MAGDNRIQITISANAADAKSAVADLERQIIGLGGNVATTDRAMGGLGGTLGTMRGLLASLGVAVVVNEIKDLGVAVFETGRQLESLGLAFKAITGSAASAQAELASIRRLAREYGQDFMDMASSTKTFVAAAKDTELAGQGARDVIKGVSAAVAALGLSGQDAQGVFLALGQMMSKGTVQAEELKGQVGERLPGAFNLAARAMGVSTAELGKMLEQGQVLATDLVPKLARALEQEYGAAAREAANTGTAAVNRLTSAWTDFKSSLADTGAFRAAVEGIQWVASTAEAASKRIRDLTNSHTGTDRLDFLNRRIQTLEGGLAQYDSQMASATNDNEIPDYISLPAWRTELEALRRERAMLSYDLKDAERAKALAQVASASERQQSQAKALEAASQQAVREARARSADPLVAAQARFESAQDKAWKDVYSGKITHEAFEQVMVEHEGVLKKAREDAAKRGASGATSAARADIKGSGVLQRIEDEITSYEESLGGNRLGASIAKIERDHNRALTQIRADLVGATGGVEALQEAEGRLGDLKALKTKQAELRAFDEELGRAARQAQEMAEWTGGSDLGAKWIEAYRQYVKELQDAGIRTDKADEERIARADERFQAHVDFLLEEDLRRLGEGGKLSDQYWVTESKRLDAHLEQVRKYASSETAYNVYASQKRSELRRQELEARLDAQDSYLGYLGDYLALEFGLYKDHTSRTRELWQELASSTAGWMRQLGQGLQDGLTDYLEALWTGDARKRETAWRDMLNNMLRDTGRWIIQMGMTLGRQVLVLPILASVVGVDSSALQGMGISLPGAQSGQGAASQVGRYAGYAKDAYGLVGGSSGWIGSLNTWGAETLGIGQSALPAITAEGNVIVPATPGIGLGTAAGGALLGAGVGYGLSQLLYPNGSGTVGGTVGGALLGAGGALLGASSMLAGTILGSVLGPLGALAGGAIGALLTGGETKKSRWTVPAGSQQAVYIVGGEQVPASFGMVTTTSSGLFGKSSKSNNVIYTPANAEMAAAEAANWAAATAPLDRFASLAGVSDDALASAKAGFSFLAPVPPGLEAEVWRNAGNAMAMVAAKTLGLTDALDGLRRAGEADIDLMTRLADSWDVVSAGLESVGLSLESLAGSASGLAQADWASDILDALGGGDAFAAVLTRYARNAYTDAEQADRTLQYTVGQAVEQLGDLGLGTDLTDFWARYRAAMEGGNLSVGGFARWGQAAVYVEQAYAAAAAAAQQQVQAERDRLTAMEATRRELESQRDAWTAARDNLRDFAASLRTDQLSTLSPTDILAERRAAYEDVLGRARAGDLAAQAEYRDAAAAYREYAHGYYGANGEYAAIDQAIQADANALISLADVQAQAHDEQLAALLEQIEVSQSILDATDLVNQNLARMLESQGVTPVRMAAGGLVTGGTWGVDSVPALLMPTERVLSVPQSRMLEAIYAMVARGGGASVDTGTLERLIAQLLAAVASGNGAMTALLARVESNTAAMASDLERA